MKKIILNSVGSKLNGDKNQFITTQFVGSNKLLPFTDMQSVINAEEQYNYERSNHNLIRLTCNVNTVCSNVLFNAFTEIVKYEGSENATCLNFEGIDTTTSNKLIYKEKAKYFKNDDRVYNAIEDTQLSNADCGYEYHCGLDFFNNHRLRSTSFKTINMLTSTDDNSIKNFNTIQDYHRTYDGKEIHDEYVIEGRDLSKSKVHIYTNDNIMTFRETFNERLKEENGWFGFINRSKIDTFIYEGGVKKSKMDISKPINNKRSCTFIDMYPGRDLYNFAPKYNSYRKRVEKNWNYCMTYPSKSITSGIPFINSDIEGGALRIFLLDDTEDSTFKFYTMSKHGLQNGDHINVYSGNTLVITSLEIDEVIDDYCFYTNKNGNNIPSEWIEYDDKNKDEYLSKAGGTSYVVRKSTNSLINTSSNFLTFSFKKIADGREVDYYVRQFSKLPNWKYCDKKVDEYTIYNYDKDLITKYSKDETQLFENHISKLAFSNNIYNDSIGKVVFTDDIDIRYLRDNNNNYLTTIYFTIIKNNKGYKKWYNEKNVKDENIEFSHCFGKVSCGFYLSPLMYDENFEYKNDTKRKYHLCDAKLINNGLAYSFSGLNVTLINGATYRDADDDSDEINYYKNINFYGDLCSYSYNEALEENIQNIEYRFNTAQREVCENWCFKYTNLKYDDYDLNKFVDSTSEFLDITEENNNGDLSEGYYYNPHYDIRVRTFSDSVTTQYGKTYSIRDISLQGDGYKITTSANNFLEKNDYFIIYDRDSNSVINAQVTEIISYNIFKCKLPNGVTLDKDKSQYRVVKKDKDFPSSAQILLDDTCRFVWRDIYENGFDKINSSGIETYPFSNGRLYINKNINLYLKRQNPSLTSVLTNPSYDLFNIKGRFIEEEKKNNYITPDEIVC